MNPGNSGGRPCREVRHDQIIGPTSEVGELLLDIRAGLEGRNVSLKVAKEMPYVQNGGIPRDHSGAVCWPPYHDPRKESRWMKESNQEPPSDAVLPASTPETVIDLYDQHVKDHMERRQKVNTLETEFIQILELAWAHRTGKLKTATAEKAASAGVPAVGTLIVEIDRAEAAAKYLESLSGWRDEMWPIVVARGDGILAKSEWGNRTPAWGMARRLWAILAMNLMRRLEREPLAGYVARLERVATYGTEERIRAA